LHGYALLRRGAVSSTKQHLLHVSVRKAIGLSSLFVELGLLEVLIIGVHLIRTQVLEALVNPSVGVGANTKVAHRVPFERLGQPLMLHAVVGQHRLRWVLFVVLKAHVLVKRDSFVKITR